MKIVPALLVLLFSLHGLLYGESLIPMSIADEAKKKYGQFSYNRFIALNSKVLKRLEGSSEMKKLNTINSWINYIKYKSDMEVYHQLDYWATLYEFVGKNAGDCEDYTIAKYYLLKAAGVDPKKMKFTYVVYRNSRGENVSHMVLSYLKVPKPKTKDDFLILDNNNLLILPASKRDDIVKVIKMINGDTGPKSKKWKQLEKNMKRKKL